MPRYWIVVCPTDRMKTGDELELWRRWYMQSCVAVGFSPPDSTLDGPIPRGGWKYKGWANARNRLKEMEIGDEVIPFPKRRRIGPVGTITDIKISDREWDPIYRADESLTGRASFGRRIIVEWEKIDMPLDGRLATVPIDPLRPRVPLTRLTIQELTPTRYRELRDVLANSSRLASL
jgi:hypothetical protein